MNVHTQLPEGLTVWSPCSEKLESEYGTITYEKWCRKEADRGNRNGKNLCVWKLLQGKRLVCCVARADDPYFMRFACWKVA